MADLSPLQTLFDDADGDPVPLPAELLALYGELRVPLRPGAPWLIANFVTTLDGVVALGEAGPTGGAEISGSNRHDRMIMGLLRSIADVVVVGAGTLRATPKHTWTPSSVFPSLRDSYRLVRSALGSGPGPTLAVVSASGNLDLDLPAFHLVDRPALVITTSRGARHLRERNPAEGPTILTAGDGESLDALAIVKSLQDRRPYGLILLEGGPTLLGRFVADRCVDELFLTSSPQIAGRDASVSRVGLVEGHHFEPSDPRWVRLVSLRRSESHLFLRYAFDR